MQSSLMPSSKNLVLARETALFRNSVIIPVTEAHRHLHSLGGDYITQANSLTALATTMDAISGDDKTVEFMTANSEIGFSGKETTNINKIFPRVPFDLAEIEGIFYDAIEAVESLLSVLGGLFSNGRENLKKVIILLSDFVNKMKKTLTDTALKVYMHTKIEMIIRNQQMLRAA